MSRFLVLGAGPIGSGVALRLAREGHTVAVATRSGSGPEHPGVTRVAIDAGDPDGLSALAAGTTAIFNCLNPPYSRWAEEWPPLHRSILTAAERSDAVIVMTDNLYSFGPDTAMPLHEGDPMTATGTKGGTRRRMAEEMLAAHAEGRVRATLARASDFFGPTVSDSSMGSRVVPRVLAGRKVSVLGRSDIPHSASYVDDVVRTLVTIATDERAWGRPWHVPSTTVSQSDLVAALAHAAATTVRVTTVPRALVNVAGIAVPFLRELRETWYQFAEPWVIDSTLTEQTFGLSATPLDDAARATVAWWAERA